MLFSNSNGLSADLAECMEWALAPLVLNDLNLGRPRTTPDTAATSLWAAAWTCFAMLLAAVRAAARDNGDSGLPRRPSWSLSCCAAKYVTCTWERRKGRGSGGQSGEGVTNTHTHTHARATNTHLLARGRQRDVALPAHPLVPLVKLAATTVAVVRCLRVCGGGGVIPVVAAAVDDQVLAHRCVYFLFATVAVNVTVAVAVRVGSVIGRVVWVRDVTRLLAVVAVAIHVAAFFPRLEQQLPLDRFHVHGVIRVHRWSALSVRSAF